MTRRPAAGGGPRSGAVPDLGRLRDLVARHDPAAAAEQRLAVADGRSSVDWQAATALVLAPGDHGPELALIERVTRAGDPWSGHVALPGGKRDPGDDDLAATAVRETREEVGIGLGQPVGRLADHIRPARRALIATYVFVLEDRPPMTPHPAEVADAWWVPLSRLVDPSTVTEHDDVERGGRRPGLQIDGRVVWGLTYRTLHNFADAVGIHLPGRRD
jgi:8-oxo-dGTP pyrophosphatase MutT (NUDIX family)